MRNDEFCLSIVSLVLNINNIMKSEHLGAGRKKELSADLSRLIRKVRVTGKVIEQNKKKEVKSYGMENPGMDTGRNRRRLKL